MIGVLVVLGIAVGGFVVARRFVTERLRFVDAIRSPVAPLVAGMLAAIVTWPLAILPLITTPMSAIFGIGAGVGTASGVKALKRGDR